MFIAAALICASTLAAGQQKPAPPEHMHHRFEDAERYAKSFDDPGRDAWQMPERVIAALKLPAGAAVADVGAGTGYFSVRLAKSLANGTVYAVDIEPGMLAHITRRAAGEKLGNVVTVQAAPDSPKLPQPVDVVLVVDTYHHIAARPAYFRAVKASLKPGGRVAIVDFRKDSPAGPPPEFRFEAAQIVREMEDAGYALETAHDFLPRQHFLVFAPAAR